MRESTGAYAPPAAPWAVLVFGALMPLLLACGGASQSVAVSTLAATARSTGPRAAVAQGYARFLASRTQRPREAAEWLAGAWAWSPSLADDRVLREALGALPTASVPRSALAGHHVERAVAALRAGDLSAARSAVGTAAAAAPSALDDLRIALLTATLDADRDADLARQRLVTLARRARPKAAGRLGAALLARARLLLAGLEQQNHRYREAIAAYLTLGPASGHFRQARVGMAWCQLLGGHSERAIQVLALLPGGLTGDPERALLAAMAAHQIGRAEAAHAVIREARRLADRWDPDAVTPAAVQAAVRPGLGEVPLNARADDIVAAIADAADTRALAAELAASRELSAPDAAPWRAAVEAAFAAHVAEAREAHAERVTRALRDLDVLEPQIPTE